MNLSRRATASAQSHAIAKRVRGAIVRDRRSASARASRSRRCRPGRPVLETLVAEIYGPDDAAQTSRSRGRSSEDDGADTEGVVDVDWYVEDDQPRTVVDRLDEEKAALDGIVKPSRPRRSPWRARARSPARGCCTSAREKEFRSSSTLPADRRNDDRGSLSEPLVPGARGAS